MAHCYLTDFESAGCLAGEPAPALQVTKKQADKLKVRHCLALNCCQHTHLAPAQETRKKKAGKKKNKEKNKEAAAAAAAAAATAAPAEGMEFSEQELQELEEQLQNVENAMGKPAAIACSDGSGGSTPITNTPPSAAQHPAVQPLDPTNESSEEPFPALSAGSPAALSPPAKASSPWGAVGPKIADGQASISQHAPSFQFQTAAKDFNPEIEKEPAARRPSFADMATKVAPAATVAQEEEGKAEQEDNKVEQGFESAWAAAVATNPTPAPVAAPSASAWGGAGIQNATAPKPDPQPVDPTAPSASPMAWGGAGMQAAHRAQ